jgi:hypothetical protein
VATSVLYMSVSLDGYIAGPNDEPGNPGGDGFDRLHAWFVSPDGEFFRPSGPAGELIDEIGATGGNDRARALGAPACLVHRYVSVGALILVQAYFVLSPPIGRRRV